MSIINIVTLNICNDNDLIYGSDTINKKDIDNFISYHKITNDNLITDGLDEEFMDIRKENFQPRFHQVLISSKIISNNPKKCLIYAKPRSGKTIICGCIIEKNERTLSSSLQQGVSYRLH